MRKKWLIGLVMGLATLPVLMVSGLAQAHTGAVVCDSRGVVFSYNANFEHATTVTEHVDAATRTFAVPAHMEVSDTWSGVTGDVVAGAHWPGGRIPDTKLHCPKPTTPPPVTPPTTPPTTTPPTTPPTTVTPPATPPAPPVAPPCVPGTTDVTPPGSPPGVRVCEKQAPPAPPCVPGTKDVTPKSAPPGTRVCERTVTKHVPAKHKTAAKKKKAKKSKQGVGGRESKPKTPKHQGGGVTG
jgi:hypothetical protein